MPCSLCTMADSTREIVDREQEVVERERAVAVREQLVAQRERELAISSSSSCRSALVALPSWGSQQANRSPQAQVHVPVLYDDEDAYNYSALLKMLSDRSPGLVFEHKRLNSMTVPPPVCLYVVATATDRIEEFYDHRKFEAIKNNVSAAGTSILLLHHALR